MKLFSYIVDYMPRLVSKKWSERALRSRSGRDNLNSPISSRNELIMNDSREDLVQVRRSSGKKEWMTREQLIELNKQRALKRKKAEKSESQHWNGLKA